MLRGRNLKPVHMGSNQGLLFRIEMGLSEHQNDALAPLPQPEQQPLKANFIAVAGGPGGDVGEA
jgi:hypothetical protein